MSVTKKYETFSPGAGIVSRLATCTTVAQQLFSNGAWRHEYLVIALCQQHLGSSPLCIRQLLTTMTSLQNSFQCLDSIDFNIADRVQWNQITSRVAKGVLDPIFARVLRLAQVMFELVS